MNKQSKILILGSGGLVGTSLVKTFTNAGYTSLLTPKRQELDLESQQQVSEYFKVNKPEVIINAAAKVGGVYANNTFRADFIFKNLLIQNNLFQASFENQVKKFLFLGSSCIYPKSAPQPISEEALLTGSLEPTNEPYAIAKIAGLKMAESFRRQYGLDYFSIMPTNLYGENDNFHPKNSHVIPGLINRMHETIQSQAESFEVWGTGEPLREFLYVDDMASACLFLLEYKNTSELPYWINVGTGEDIAIKELVTVIAKEMGFEGQFHYNTEFPDGMMRKRLNVSKLHKLGWRHSVSLQQGIEKTVTYFKTHFESLRRY